MSGRTKRSLWIIVGGLLLCVGLPALLIGQQYRQESLDRELFVAVKRLDAPKVDRLLGEGANARTTGRASQPPTAVRLLAQLIAPWRHDEPEIDYGDAQPALSLILDWGFGRQRSEAEDTIAAALIRHGADINTLDEKKLTPLHVAVYFKYRRTVRELLARGAAVDAQQEDNPTPLMFADADSALLLLGHGANVNATSNSLTPLMYALNDGRFDAAKVLIEHGADVNACDEFGHSVLYRLQVITRAPDKTDMIQFLERHGARLNRIDKHLDPEKRNKFDNR